MTRKAILLELNEINFDIVSKYLSDTPKKYPGFKELFSLKNIQTIAEEEYEELEPWIQWVSVHSGLSYSEHKIFRLGDIVGSKIPQIFELVEKNSFSVGCISPINAENRLFSPAYFIPDPWTSTPTDGSWWSKRLAHSVSQTVNDNAQAKITIRSYLYLALAFLRFAKPSRYAQYLKLALTSKGKPWRKALFLDLLLHDIHMRFMNRKNVDFSTLFLNAGAHIQHHYFFNSRHVMNEGSLRNPSWYILEKFDPIEEMLEVYDGILSEYTSLGDYELVVATGLSQCPYDRVKYYYRIRNHKEFLDSLGINYKLVSPRMTRDFLVKFENEADVKAAYDVLSSINVSEFNEKLFGVVDKRGDSLFVTLTFSHEIDEETKFTSNDNETKLKPHVVFVAIKNGMHQGKGFAFFTDAIGKMAPKNNSHVKKLHNTIREYFSSD